MRTAAARPFLAACLLLAAPAAAHAAWASIDLPRQDVTLRAAAVQGPARFSVAGSKGTFATTTDGGKTWRLAALPDGEAHDVRGHAWIDARTAVALSAGEAAAGQAKLFRTTDGGATWSLVAETKEPGAFFDAIAFWDRRDGLVMGDPVGGAWFLLRTADGGRSWTRVAATMPPLKPGEAAFAASNTALSLGRPGEAWIVSGGGEHGRVFRTTDFGRTWQVTDVAVAGSATSGLFGAFHAGGGRGVVVGGDYKDELRAGPNIAVTADGGATWTLATQTGTPRLLEAVGRLDAKTLLAVGPRGTSVSHDDGRSWTQVDEQAFHAIACAHGTCVAAGGKGHVGVWR